MNVEKAIEFIKRNARPVELAEFQCLFENGPKAALVEALKPYQNSDGGFGHALEPDNWNPNSTPITTNDALIYLFETGALFEAGEMAKGMVRYLTSGAACHSENRHWLNSVDSNGDYPHAIWWEKGEADALPGWNPTVSLAAFLVCMGEDGPWAEMVRQAFDELRRAEEKEGGDDLKCYMLAWRLLKAYGLTNIVDLPAGRRAIEAAISQAVCKETEKYGVEYVPCPSWYLQEKEPFMPEGMDSLIQAELDALGKLQQADGGLDISWRWYTSYEKEFQQARDWWRPRVTMEKLRLYL